MRQGGGLAGLQAVVLGLERPAVHLFHIAALADPLGAQLRQALGEIDDGLRMLLMMVTGHYYKNREMLGLADPKYGLEAVELGAMSLLGQYRQFW